MGSTSVWMTFFPRIGKESGHGLFTCSDYMYLRDGILAPNDKNSSRLVRSSHLGILTIFVRGRLEDPAECAGSPKRDELRIDEIVRIALRRPRRKTGLEAEAILTDRPNGLLRC